MKYSIRNAYIKMTVSSIGAEMQSIVRDDVEYLWNGDAKYWSEQAPILFPFVGRFTGGKYTLDGKEYEMDIHGFARRLPFEVVNQETESITFEMTDSEETYHSYPYHFRLNVTYTLRKETVEIIYSVKNDSDRTMYFGIGGHPGFKVPLEEGLEFTDYYLEFEAKSYPERVGHTKECFLNGENKQIILEDHLRFNMSHSMFDEDAIVLQNMADCVTLQSDKGNRKVTLSYPDMPYLGLWHVPKTEAPYICIEPWTSLPSRQDIVEELRYKADLIRLKAKGTYKNKWSIRIQLGTEYF